MSNNEEKKDSNLRIVAACFLVAIVILIVGFGVAFSYFQFEYDKDTQTESTISSQKYNVETSLTSASAVDATNLQLIDASEAGTQAPSLNFTVKGNGKFNVYLKDIAISSNMINSAFKWEVVMDGSIIASGDFSDIITNGVVDNTKTSTEQMKYFSRYDLKNNISFNGNNTSNMTVRVYLLNDPVNDQSSLLGGTFENKVAIESKSN